MQGDWRPDAERDLHHHPGVEERGDIVCTFKNVESIFNDLLKLYRNGQFNGVASVRAACLFHA